jgi:hypothetical protein
MLLYLQKNKTSIKMFLKEYTYKPGSVLNSHLSRIYIAIYLKPPLQEASEQLFSSLLGVAPDEEWEGKNLF